MPLHCWSVGAIPDPRDRSLGIACGGDVRRRVFRVCLETLRAVATLEPGSLAIALRFVYRPERHRDRRCEVEILASGDDSALSIAGSLIARGPLASLFDLRDEGQSDERALPESLAHCIDVVRREDAVRPSEHRRHDNPNIPERYYRLNALDPRHDNDLVALDRCLDGMTAPAVVELIITPAEVTREREVHSLYLLQLMRVNRSGEQFSEHAIQTTEGFDVPRMQALADPVADDVRRGQEAIHQALGEAHLHFNLRIWSASAQEVPVIAATVAEGAVAKGRYRLVGSNAGDERWPRLLLGSARVSPSDEPLAPEIWGGHGAGMSDLRRLCRLATVDELAGAFALPVGTGASGFLTMRLHTDPRPLPAEEAGVLIGHDVDSGQRSDWEKYADLEEAMSTQTDRAEVRVPVRALTRHVSIWGLQGSGKTVAILNLLIQLGLEDAP